MWLIRTDQNSRRLLKSLNLYLDSSRGYKINKKSVNQELVRKQATLVYRMMKRSVLLKTISLRKQLWKLKNLSKKMNIRRFHFRKMVFHTRKEGY